ncbi:MAG: ABC transporter permease, partial [Clostridia bacterium]
AVFFLLFLFNLRQVKKSDPIELLHGENVGEKEPKVKKLLVIVGILTLGAGYAISLMMTELQTVVAFFFIPVILVVIGTYCLFTSGSIAVLKAMKKKKSYYYQPQHFISVSGMLYRMKQNAAGLASICVLSTMVLVILSTTVSLYAGMKDVMDYRYPTNTHVASADISEAGKTAVYDAIDRTEAETGLSVEPAETYVSLASTMYQKGNTFQTGSGSLVYTVFLNEEDYTELTGKTLHLSEGETVLYVSGAYEPEDAVILGQTYRIRDRLTENPAGKLSYIMNTTFVFVLPDDGFREQIGKELTKAYGMTIVPMFQCYFDVEGSDEDVLAFYHRLVELSPADADIECRQDNVDDFYVLYGGFLFIGLFLGVTFLMATVLIIYYKQLIEGYEDRGRFEIMRRVGMEKSLIRASVKSQVLTMFALPLLAAAVHLIFAFPLLSRMLHALNLTNIPLFIGCTAVTFAVFAVFYVATYLLTARAYYTVVSSDR